MCVSVCVVCVVEVVVEVEVMVGVVVGVVIVVGVCCCYCYNIYSAFILHRQHTTNLTPPTTHISLVHNSFVI